MRVGLFTREFPPHVYGGAGVHVDYLSRELAKEIGMEVHCWGPQKFQIWHYVNGTNGVNSGEAANSADCSDSPAPGFRADVFPFGFFPDRFGPFESSGE